MSTIGSSQKVLNGVTSTTTSQPSIVKRTNKLTIFMQRSNHTAGSSAFTVEVSPDYANQLEAGTPSSAVWVPYRRLIDNVTNTNAQNLTRIQTKTLSTNGSDFVTLDLSGETFQGVRVVATIATDGSADAWIIIQE